MLNIVMKFSKLCNLRCTYCYEYDELGLKERMPIDGIHHFLRSFTGHYIASGWSIPVMFVWHGGEPLLLPSSYIRTVVEMQNEYLGAAGITFENAMQTNLVRFSDEQINLLKALRFSIGFSFDVFGGARINGPGGDSTTRVLDNLQRLFNSNAIADLKMGGIAVLHKANIHRVEHIYDFYQQLGLALRLLPIFSLGNVPARMRHLTLSHEEVVEAFQKVARLQFQHTSPIPILPLDSYLESAVSQLSELQSVAYDPAQMEWALIVNTNGDTYSNGESYMPEGRMGNIFKQEFSSVWSSTERQATIAVRQERASVCERCRFRDSCSHLPMIEALPCERAYDADGNLVCPITKPMIEFMMDQIQFAGGLSALSRCPRSSVEPILLTPA